MSSRSGGRRAAHHVAAPWALCGAALCLSLGLTGCADTQGPPPRVTVTCPPGQVDIAVTNRSTHLERYTVTVSFIRAGDTETDSYSSNGVAPGESATISDSRPDEEQTCSVDKTEVFR